MLHYLLIYIDTQHKYCLCFVLVVMYAEYHIKKSIFDGLCWCVAGGKPSGKNGESAQHNPPRQHPDSAEQAS